MVIVLYCISSLEGATMYRNAFQAIQYMVVALTAKTMYHNAFEALQYMIVTVKLCYNYIHVLQGFSSIWIHGLAPRETKKKRRK